MSHAQRGKMQMKMVASQHPTGLTPQVRCLHIYMRKRLAYIKLIDSNRIGSDRIGLDFVSQLLQAFEPRPPVAWIEPPRKRKKMPAYTGPFVSIYFDSTWLGSARLGSAQWNTLYVCLNSLSPGLSNHLDHFLPRDDPDYQLPITRAETKAEKVERKRGERLERGRTILESKLAEWEPQSIENATEDPFKTLFVARVVRYARKRVWKYLWFWLL